MKTFIPFHEIKNHEKVLGVDCFHPKAFSLSHWRGAACREEIWDDTSAGICLNAIRQNIPELAISHLSSNHFDIDGFVGIWALMNPELALEHEEVLRQMALIGDFREFDTQSKSADKALKLVCWINKLEAELFYEPFGSDLTEEKEGYACVEKFDYFLTHFEAVLLSPELGKDKWMEEYQEVLAAVDKMKSAENQLHPDIRLKILKTKEPLHYYAVFLNSELADMVLSIYDNQCYELEYKYTTWVNTYLREQFPRIDLQPLAELLNQIEQNRYTWTADKISDTGPILRLNKEKLNKVERFRSPNQREIYPSSIPEKQLEQTVITYFQHKLKNQVKSNHFSWEEIRRINGLAEH